MKYLGIGLLAVGVAIAAAFGAQNPPGVHRANELSGTAALVDGAAGTEAALALEALEPETPTERLRSWLAGSGAPFLGGIGLIIVGALLARGAARRDTEDDSTGARVADGGPVDFAALLREIAAEATSLAAVADACTTTQAFDALRARVQKLQTEKVERLVAARQRVERRYGLAGFAAIFSPLSSGERLVNRSWSALADHHAPEAANSLRAASSAFEEALAQVESAAATA